NSACTQSLTRTPVRMSSSPSAKKASTWKRDFFFSSRRRHTSCLSDWSSDVCSSDLRPRRRGPRARRRGRAGGARRTRLRRPATRSEERRVGKECRLRLAAQESQNNANSGADAGDVRIQSLDDKVRTLSEQVELLIIA